MIQLENQIIEIGEKNISNNHYILKVKKDKYASKYEMKGVYLPELESDIKNAINAIVEQHLKINYGYEVVNDVWHEIDWNFRVYINDNDLKTILSNPICAPIVLSLFSTPINPCYKLSEGCLYYLNNKDENMINLLLSIDIIINIEDKF
jgi:hypothetical protein